MKKTIGIVGCGTIGSVLAASARKDLKDSIAEVILWDTDKDKLADLSKKLGDMPVAESLQDIVKKCDLIIEAASPASVPDFLKAVLAEGKDAMVMSIGGILGNEGLLGEAAGKGRRVILPTGAIAGIDAVKAAKISGIESVTITTRKPPRSVKGAPYLEKNNIDVDAITAEEVIFEGNAKEAMKGFPKNVNVSALLSLAGIGAENTTVKIVVSPEFTGNSHEIAVESGSGRITTRTENVPSPDNPKTSYLAALAAAAALKEYFTTVRIGT